MRDRAGDYVQRALFPVALGLLLASACRGPREPLEEPCGGVVGEVEASSTALQREVHDSAMGVSDSLLRQLLRDHWHDRLTRSPDFAARRGVEDFASHWAPQGAEARARNRSNDDAYLERARALGDGQSLSGEAVQLDEADQLTLALFIAELESAEAQRVCEFWAWSVSIRSNPLAAIAGFAERAKVDTPEQLAALRSRYAEFPAYVEARMLDLRDGLGRGLVADAESLTNTIDMLERELALEPAQSSLVGPGKQVEDQGYLLAELVQRTQSEIHPALAAYLALLKDELLPAARAEAEVGIGALPAGADCYAALIQRHISEARSAEELHQLGLAEIARIDDEFRVLGERVFGTGELDAVLERLRTDPELYFETAEEVETFARESLAAAEAAAPAFFGRLPQAPCEVRPIPEYEAPYTTIAYYNQPGEGEPGAYYINTYAPTTRPRYEARVLAIHEAVPGHHTQVALAQELPETPAFRRHGGFTAFVEGWALYTERLADEMGLYEGDLDRLGVLSFDAWRASRLVVDTGIHAKGWTRQQAIDFMLAHTALAENNIVNEVDRYVGWPGQALAYKYGQLEILRLRAEAESALGEGFSLPAFHDLVLGAGAVTLPILRQRVTAWIEARRANPE